MSKPDLRTALKSQIETKPDPKPARAQEKRRDPHFRPSREGKVNITGYYDPAVKIQLRQIAMTIDHRTTIQDCLTMALNDFFAKHGKPEIAC
jgi:Antitoxin-like ribbon-helix-helix